MNEVEIVEMDEVKRIALIAHDNRKQDLLDWASYNVETLKKHKLYATWGTGTLLEEKLGLEVIKFKPGPLGGDQEVGSLIANNGVDILVFFWDPLEPMPHDPDVKALLRIAVVWNVVVVSDKATADFVVSSPFFEKKYPRLVRKYEY
ncbi:MAG TPA: methylglyoxal synthase [Coprothermobacter proteolyticus]|uniref:Methylglyoxal synthase n=1 Tax=Coprothermobacter proteolyticus (strain ATCC 35245 / DSM 5265 / OCM 4 / BT) TaxID=309798 RepID=B5Y6Y7_COPPD|nr:methylglyoxal synthase [Coprothermobacter proteolyticus]ACI17297.1 methylglyoxal synthase [Coprothermobacter proteolyticus DSM 5265]MBP8984022.1 methylglyoxal synthase [Coprothermobacter sp.]HPU70094.1 methylglyoxal synthase [Coprothermobacter proteolyticus]